MSYAALLFVKVSGYDLKIGLSEVNLHGIDIDFTHQLNTKKLYCSYVGTEIYNKNKLSFL